MTDAKADVTLPTTENPRIGFCRTPQWPHAEPATVAALEGAADGAHTGGEQASSMLAKGADGAAIHQDLTLDGETGKQEAPAALHLHERQGVEMIITPKELKARFEYQFTGKHLGRTFYRGWFPTFVQLCDGVDALLAEDKRGFNWLQIKEKWGVLCVYIHHDLEATSEEIRRQADRILAEAERESGAICEVCGQPGRTDGPPPGMSGPVLTLCEPHRRVYYYTG